MGFLLIFLGLGSREIVLANSLLLYSLSFTPYGAGPSLTSVPWSHGFDSISFQKEKSFCHCMKPCCLPDLPIHHPNTPTHPSFPKIYDKCWNEIRNCRECLTSLATCHWRTAPCIFLLCDIFIFPNFFLHILAHRLVKSHNFHSFVSHDL